MSLFLYFIIDINVVCTVWHIIRYQIIETQKGDFKLILVGEVYSGLSLWKKKLAIFKRRKIYTIWRETGVWS